MGMTVDRTEATLGAILKGVSIIEIDTHSLSRIKELFLDHALLIFPGQFLDAQEQIEFAKNFGAIEVLVENMNSIRISNKAENGRLMDGKDEQMKLLKGNEGWHTDSSYMPRAAKASVLSAHVVPSVGGETQWADARAAYDSLEVVTKNKLKGLRAQHNYFRSQAKIGHKVAVGAAYGFFEGESPEYPLVKVHPETGRAALYVGRHACEIPGMASEEAENLLAELNKHITQEPYVYSHKWVPGDVVIWDNRCALHRARPYDQSQERLMMQTRIRGERESETAINYG